MREGVLLMKMIVWKAPTFLKPILKRLFVGRKKKQRTESLGVVPDESKK